MLDCLNFHELLDIDLVMQSELSFFINFSQSAIYSGLPLVYLAFREI